MRARFSRGVSLQREEGDVRRAEASERVGRVAQRRVSSRERPPAAREGRECRASRERGKRASGGRAWASVGQGTPEAKARGQSEREEATGEAQPRPRARGDERRTPEDARVVGEWWREL